MTPITNYVSFVSSRPDPDWITKAVAASRHEATLKNQVVEAQFVTMIVTVRPIIELLDSDDDIALDVAPGVTPGVVPCVALGIVLASSSAPDVKPSTKTNEMLMMKPCDTPHECLQRFKFYRSILPYLVMFRDNLASSKG
jgi:hypothetical protein